MSKLSLVTRWSEMPFHSAMSLFTNVTGILISKQLLFASLISWTDNKLPDLVKLVNGIQRKTSVTHHTNVECLKTSLYSLHGMTFASDVFYTVHLRKWKKKGYPYIFKIRLCPGCKKVKFLVRFQFSVSFHFFLKPKNTGTIYIFDLV